MLAKEIIEDYLAAIEGLKNVRDDKLSIEWTEFPVDCEMAEVRQEAAMEFIEKAISRLEDAISILKKEKKQ